MADNGIPVAVARLYDLTHKIRIGQRLTELEAHEFFNFSPAEVPYPDDIPLDLRNILELMQKMQNGPPFTEDEINEILQIRRERLASQISNRIYRYISRTLPWGQARRSDQLSRAFHAIHAVVIAASMFEEPAVVEARAITAAQGAEAAWAAAQAQVAMEIAAAAAGGGPRVDCMQVHTVSAIFKDKLPLVAVIIRENIGAGPQRPSFIEHLDATIGKCVRESPLFESKMKPNSSEVRTRTLWLNDYERVKVRLTSALNSIPPDLIQLLGDILDLVFKYSLEECYVSTFLYDTAHAYEGDGRANESSCPAGAVERVYTTLFDCIKGMNKGVFGEINRVLGGEQPTSWEELDKASKTAYQREFDSFVMKWAQANEKNDELQKMTAAQRNEAVLAAFKARSDQPPLPPMVEGFIRRELFRGLTILWPDIGFNSANAGNAGGGSGSAQGGRKTRHKKRRNRKTYRKNKNKNKKSMKRRH